MEDIEKILYNLTVYNLNEIMLYIDIDNFIINITVRIFKDNIILVYYYKDIPKYLELSYFIRHLNKKYNYGSFIYYDKFVLLNINFFYLFNDIIKSGNISGFLFSFKKDFERSVSEISNMNKILILNINKLIDRKEYFYTIKTILETLIKYFPIVYIDIVYYILFDVEKFKNYIYSIFCNEIIKIRIINYSFYNYNETMIINKTDKYAIINNVTNTTFTCIKSYFKNEILILFIKYIIL